MKIVQYIKSDRRGEHARELELESLQDAFLADALDGYNADAGQGAQHARDLLELEQGIVHSRVVRHKGLIVSLLAAVAAIVAAAVLLWPEGQQKPAGAEEKEMLTPVEAEQPAPVPVPVPVPKQPEPLPADTSGIAKIAADTASRASGKMLFAILPPSAEEAAELPEGRKYFSRPRVGAKTFNEYLDRAMVMPQGVGPGEVTLSFRVNSYGRPSIIRIEASYNQDAGREAIRLIEGGPEWFPTDSRVSVTLFLQ